MPPTVGDTRELLMDSRANTLELIESGSALALELIRTQRAWAVQLLTKRPGWSLNDWLERVAECPDPVRQLIGTYVGRPVGKCEKCGNIAPLTVEAGSVGLLDKARCAWGCLEAPG
jgi:hypothetical protein